MPLSESTLNEIRTELVGLHHLQDQLNDRIKALEAILTPFEFQSALPFPASKAMVVGAHINSTTKLFPGSVVQEPGPYAATGLRPAILDVLVKNGPMRAPAVARILKERGFPSDGSKTALPIRVYNDLWRMGNNGLVKNESGVFGVK